MAVPKRRTSHARQGNRRSHLHLKRDKTPIASAAAVPSCRTASAPNCGSYYQGREVVAGGKKRRSKPCKSRWTRWAAIMPPGRSSPAPCRPSQADPELQVVLVGDQAQIEPLLGRRRPRPRPAGDLPLHAGRHHGRNARGGPAQEARQLHQPLLATAGRAQGRGHRQRRQHRGHGRRRPASALFLKNVRRPGIAAVMPHSQGPVRAARRRRQRQPQAGAPVPVRRHGQHLRPAHPAARKPDHRPDERRLGRAKGHDLAKETHALFNASPLSGPVHRQHRGPRHQQGRLRRDRHRRLRRQRGAQGLRGRLRVRHEDGRPRSCWAPWTPRSSRPSRPCKTWSTATITSEHGGAPLLGIDGICIICHGSSGDRAIKNALAVAAQYVRAKLNELIVQELETAAGSRRGCRNRPVLRPLATDVAVTEIAVPVYLRMPVPKLLFFFPARRPGRRHGPGALRHAAAPPSCSTSRGHPRLRPGRRVRRTARPNGSIAPSSASRPSSSPAWPPWNGCAARNPAPRRRASATAGLSLGEYTALVFAGRLDVSRRPAAGAAARRGHAGGRRRHAQRHGQRPGPGARRRSRSCARRRGRPAPSRSPTCSARATSSFRARRAACDEVERLAPEWAP